MFVAVSFMLFLMVRPFAYKYLYGKRTKTNVDSLTGRKAVVRTVLIMWQVQGPPFWPVRPGLPGRQRRIPLKQVMWWLYPLSAGAKAAGSCGRSRNMKLKKHKET